MKFLTPFVNWGQDQQTIYVNVDLKDAEIASIKYRECGDLLLEAGDLLLHLMLATPIIEFTDTSLTFQCHGIGVAGIRDYKFELSLFSTVISEECKYKLTARYIEIKLPKCESGLPWPRLISSTEKRAWLKIDFDHFMMDSNTEDEVTEQRAEHRERQTLRRSIEERNRLNGTIVPVTFRLVYLMLFNMFQMVGYAYIMATLIAKYIIIGPEIKHKAYEVVHAQVACVLSMSVMEIVHPYFGWVKTDPIITMLQVFGRGLVFFLLIMPEPLLHKDASVFWLFMVWCSIEIVRYPFYAFNLIKKKYTLLTWLRYTIWIPLYPIGFILEGFIIVFSLPLIQKSNRYSLLLPNKLNFSFSFSIFIQIYMIISLPGMYMLMQRMYNQRCKKIPLRKHIKKS